MKRLPVLWTALLSFTIAACSKDKFETKPSLEITDYNSRNIFQGGQLMVVMNYTDKEGDLNQGILTAIIRRQNLIPVLDPNQEKADTLIYQLPDFPPRDKGEITFRLGYDRLKESLIENDTILMRFSVADRANNISDTVISETIVIHLP